MLVCLPYWYLVPVCRRTKLILSLRSETRKASQTYIFQALSFWLTFFFLPLVRHVFAAIVLQNVLMPPSALWCP